ncbi:MAG: YaiI/YqxD family protein [Myxococcales bacterium]|nr:YaiI/YqxD family protein [Myxococcales bacterium]
MKVWVDGDGIPRMVKDIVFRAAEKRGVDVVIVANRPVTVPRHARIRAVQVERGLDVADEWIVSQVETGDLVITSDVPLAAEIVARGATGLSARGEMFTAENVRARLSERDFFTEARAAGIIEGGGPRPFDARAANAFANAFDSWLTRALRA